MINTMVLSDDSCYGDAFMHGYTDGSDDLCNGDEGGCDGDEDDGDEDGDRINSFSCPVAVKQQFFR